MTSTLNRPLGDDGKEAIAFFVYRKDGEWETKINIPVHYSKNEAMDAYQILIDTLIDPEISS